MCFGTYKGIEHKVRVRENSTAVSQRMNIINLIKCHLLSPSVLFVKKSYVHPTKFWLNLKCSLISLSPF